MKSIVEYLFPPRCPVCDDVRPVHAPLCCPECREKLIFVGNQTCCRCGKPVYDSGVEYCYDCRKKSHAFSAGVSLFVYEDVIRESMMRFKYHGREEYSVWYISELWKQKGRQLKAFCADAVVPVPIHATRYRQRGYNQAEALARELSHRLELPVRRELLRRTKATSAQKALNDVERLRNLLEAFSAPRQKKRTTPERVILVDDIYTTGSTLEACTRVLKKAGVSEVMVVTVCIGSGYT